MQYSSILLALFAASGSMALPQFQTADNIIEVTLGGNKFFFKEGVRDVKAANIHGAVGKVALKVSSGVDPAYRCQITDENNKPIVITRGKNIDTTFADGNNGAWTIRKPTTVKNIICDPNFVKISESELETALEVHVQLGGPDELATQTGGFNGRERQAFPPTASSGPYNTVEIIVGAFVEKQDIRCKIIDEKGNAVTAKRGANVDTTFSDADKGLWNFINPKKTSVSKIICDPAFKSVN